MSCISLQLYLLVKCPRWSEILSCNHFYFDNVVLGTWDMKIENPSTVACPQLNDLNYSTNFAFVLSPIYVFILLIDVGEISTKCLLFSLYVDGLVLLINDENTLSWWFVTEHESTIFCRMSLAQCYWYKFGYFICIYCECVNFYAPLVYALVKFIFYPF